ncbi:DUF932 domain-containing protein [Mycolicibacter kumamotonensis]|uniref:DUF945 domain-containing protein n=1 Tax=Mycolicibacter kumamotonensis TaxID=354243 RepID=A0A1B8SL11_9MYCO|nr:DUF932 domain-containing protein [Mycolicibacter kumamotonensis]OBY33421.1 hypothetical protein ACT18_00200 [Mycolicibacter kumamotonensis]
MGHQLSITDGVASFADSRVRNGKVDAWHKLGTPVGHAMTAQEALDAAFLANWNVRKVPVTATIAGADGEAPSHIVVPGKFATVFDNPVSKQVSPIGVVGKKYGVIQNEALTEFADALVDEGGAHYETAGSLQSYSKVFITMKLPRHLSLIGLDGSIDTTEWYLVLFNSHDGSSAMFGVITTVRVVCANTANAAIRGAKSKFTVRHTKGYRSAVQEAREQLRLTWEYEDAFEAEARALFEQPFSGDDMKLFSQELVKLDEVDPTSPAATQRRNQAGSIHKLFVESPAIVGTPVAATRFGAFQAVTEYVDHHAGVRGAKDVDIARATRTMLQASAGGGLKEDAWKILTSV